MSRTPRKALTARATEAQTLVEQLLTRYPRAELAKLARVSERTVIRWQREGRAPHPLLLEGLRRLWESGE